jgi:hypothetical protein
MSDKQIFCLAHKTARDGAIKAVMHAPDGYYCEIKEPSRTLEQNALLHGILTDFERQIIWHGNKFNKVVWKRLGTASWLREEGENPLLVPALDQNGFDVIYEKTSHLNIKQCSRLIEWCYAFGSEQGVKFEKY